MKFLIVDYFPCSANLLYQRVFIRFLYYYLTNAGHTVDIANLSSFDVHCDWLDRRCAEYDVIWYFVDDDNPAVFSVRRKLRERGVVQVANNHDYMGPNPFYMGMGEYFDPSNTRVNWKKENVVEPLDMIMVNSEYLVTEYQRLFDDTEKFHLLGLVVDPEQWDSYRKPFLKEGEPRKVDVTFACRLSEDKQRYLMAAFAEQAVAEGLTVRGMFLDETEKGSRERDKVENLYAFFEHLGVEVVKNMLNSAAYTYYAASEYLVAFPIIDTLNMAALEAIALGVKPVYPHIAPYSEYIDPVLLFDPYSVGQALSVVKRFKGEPERDFQNKRDRYTPAGVTARLDTLMPKIEGIVAARKDRRGNP